MLILTRLSCHLLHYFMPLIIPPVTFHLPRVVLWLSSESVHLTGYSITVVRSLVVSINFSTVRHCFNSYYQLLSLEQGMFIFHTTVLWLSQINIYQTNMDYLNSVLSYCTLSLLVTTSTSVGKLFKFTLFSTYYCC